MADSEGAVERARKLGNYFYKQKQYDAAIIAYKKGLEVEKENVLLLSNLSQVYMATKNYAEAEVIASRALTLDPTWYKCYNRAAISAENTGQQEKACAYLKKGIEILEGFDASEKEETSVELYNFKQELARIEGRVHITGPPQPCGLVLDSDNEDNEDYDVGSDAQSVSSLNAYSTGRDAMIRSDSLGKVNLISSGYSVNRSRSSSVPPAMLHAAASKKKETVMPPPKSTSSAIKKKKIKKKTGPIKMEDLESDAFISFLSTASLVPDDNVERAIFFQQKKQEMRTLLLEGSQALEADIYTAAVQKFRTVYDDLLQFPYQNLGLKEMDVVVIRYLLCFCWVSLTIYEDVIQAIKMMREMEVTLSSKFPAIYYTLGLAFYKLNRFKSAATYVEKGLEFIAKNMHMSAYSYPGTVSKPIRETTREGFEHVLTELLTNCCTHHQPNAVCRYEDCHKHSQHIEPSELIFYNDPDFNGFIVVICEEKCKIEYHVQCWKDFKESCGIGKVTDKDMLGENCPTKDCVTKKNQQSVIVRIEVIGENATIKTSLDLSRNIDTAKDARMNKRKHVSSESIADKLKQRSGHEKSKEKEHETLKELRRQEKYRKSELETDQEEASENQKSTNKNKLEEKRRPQKIQKDVFNFTKEVGKPRKIEHERVKIITVEKSEEEEPKMLNDNKIGTSYDAFEMPCDPLFGNDEYVEGEESEVLLDIQFDLHDDDCLSDFTEEMLINLCGSLWKDEHNSQESRFMDPCKAFFGAEVLKDRRRFLPESKIECPEDEVKEFICSYMYEYLRSADSQTIQDVNEKWIEDCDELKMDLSGVEKYQGPISELLLASPFFAAFDDHFGLSEFVPVLHDMLKEELRESYDFIFCRNEEIQESADIYNSQEDLNFDEKQLNNHGETERCEVHINETESIHVENNDDFAIKKETEESLENNSKIDVIEDSNQVVNDKVDDEEFETPITKERRESRNSLNPDATEFCLSADSLEVCGMEVTAKEANIDHTDVSSQVIETKNNEDSFPSSYNGVKWSSEDGVTKQPIPWDPDTIANSFSKECSTNNGQSQNLNSSVQNEELPLQQVKNPLSDETVTTLSEMLAPLSEDQLTIWTGVLNWTALDSESHSLSGSVLCSSKVKHVKLSASLWPQEMTMQLVSRDFIEAIGLNILCKFSDIVTFKPKEENSDSLSQYFGSEYAGFIVNKTSVDTTIIVVTNFDDNTQTYVGLAPHQSFVVLSGMLADVCHQDNLADRQTQKTEMGVQTDDADYNLKQKTIEEENNKLKNMCDDQKERIASLTSTVELLQSQRGSLQLQLDAKERWYGELVEKSSQQDGEKKSLQDKILNLENQVQDLDNKLQEQVKRNQDLESNVKVHITEKREIEKRLSEGEKKWAEDQEQMKNTIKEFELSKKLLNTKVEVFEETNRDLHDELNSNENEFKLKFKTLTDQNTAHTEEVTKLRQKLNEMDQLRQELQILNEELRKIRHVEHDAHLQELWNCKFQVFSREAMIVQECCKGRLEELTHLASAVVSSGNIMFCNEVNSWLKAWQSCFQEATLQFDTLKETYKGLLEKVRLGEEVNFPEFKVAFPSKPQNLVDEILKINKTIPLLPTLMPVVFPNPSQFAGSPVYYPPFTNPLYISQPSGFTHVPVMNLPQPSPAASSGNIVKAKKSIADKSSSLRSPKAPVTAVQNAHVNNIYLVDPASGEAVSSVEKKPGTVAESGNKTTTNALLNSQTQVTQASASTAVTTVESKPVVAPKLPAADIAPKLPAADIAPKLPAADIAPKLPAADIAPKLPAADKVAKPPFVSNSFLCYTTDSATTVTVQPKPIPATVPGAGTPAARTISSIKPTSVPVKTVPARQPIAADTVTNTKVGKPPSLVELSTRMPVTQTGKVQQNSKSKNANFQKLLADLRKKYPNKSDEELETCVLVARERNNNKLTGLPLPTIILMVGKVLQEQARKKDGGSVGLDKFGTTAWQLKTAETVQWSKPKDTSDEECTICIEPLGTQGISTLYCKHSFHTSCIRKWLHNESVCPICRIYTHMTDEFPPLA